MNLTPEDKTKIANQILTAKAEGKAAYALADRLTKRLARHTRRGELVECTNGLHKVVNNFAKKDGAIAIGFARRFSLEKASKEDLKQAVNAQ